MQETIFVRTCGLNEDNIVSLARDIKDWLPHIAVYVQTKPARIIIFKGYTSTIINEGDVFSFVQRNGEPHKMHDIVNHSEKRDTVRVNIDGCEFLIETFVYKKVGDTENVKFRLTYLFNPEASRDFDDYASLCCELNNYLWGSVDKGLLL